MSRKPRPPVSLQPGQPSSAPGAARLPFPPGAAALVIFGLVLFCYWPALHGSILWDDPAHLTRPELRSWAGLGRIWTDFHSTQQYYPVLFSAFWLEHRAWGDHTFGYHLVNLVLHFSSCCLLAAVLRRLWSTPAEPTSSAIQSPVPAGAAWLAAAIFAVHPIAVESVAWITEQKNTLSLVFYLLAALAYLEFDQSRRWRWHALATLLFLFALGSKTVTVTLPAALLVLVWWKQGRLRWREDVGPLVPWFAIAASVGFVTSWVERKVIGAEGAGFALSWLERFQLAGRAVWFYLEKFVWPARLNFFYPRWDLAGAGAGWLVYPAGAAAVTLLLWVWRKHARGPLAAWLIFVGGLTPVLGFFNVFFFKFSFVNDHFLYVPSLALIALGSAGAGLGLARCRGGARGVALAGGSLLLGALALVARDRSALYRDNVTLFRATIAENPTSWMAHHILGFALAKTPDGHAEAAAEFRRAIALKPDYPDSHLGLAVELAREPASRPAAMAEYAEALRLRPYYAEAHNGLGVELARIPGRRGEAIAHFEEAVRIRPNLLSAQVNLGEALARQPERQPEAIVHFEQALRLNPDLAGVHCDLANCLGQQAGRAEEAIEHYRIALQLQPNLVNAYNGMAITHLGLGRPDLARSEWETALKIDPNFQTARRNLQLLNQSGER